MASSHNHPNNVEAATEHKRVSFGGEEHVQMIVYDDGLTDDYSIGNQNKPNSRLSMAFTEPNAPPSRVKVTAENAQLPRPISPPAQIGTFPSMTSSSQPAALASGAPGTSGGGTITSTATLVTSPPLPSLVKRAENDNENPFRPDEQLYHEVDPIVEAYRQRPFPPSPTHGSPVPPHQMQQTTSSAAWSTPTKRTGSNQHQQQANGGSGRGGGRNNSLAEARRCQSPPETDQLLYQTNTTPTGDGIGPPHKAEVIHLEEEKKKRACCQLQ